MTTDRQRSDAHERDLEALCALGAAVSGALPLDDGLERSLAIVCDRLGVPMGAIFVLDDGGDMRLAAARNVPAGMAELVQTMPTVGLTRVLAHPERGWLLRAGTPEWETTTAAIHDRLGCVGAAPLIARGQVAGALFVAAVERDAVSEDAVLFLTTAGRQIGISIDHARLLQREQRRREQAEALQATGLTLAGKLDIDALLGLVLDQIGRVAPSDSSAFFLTADGETPALVASRGFGSRIEDQPAAQCEHSLLSEVVRTRQPVIVDDVQADERWTPGPNTRAVRSWMGIPLVHNGALVGCLTLDRHQPGWYTPEHAELAASFAAQAALAVANARLHHEAQGRLDRLSAMYRAVQSLTETVDLPTVIEAAVHSAVEHTSFPMAAVVLLRPETRTFDAVASLNVPDSYTRLFDRLSMDSPLLQGGALERAMRTHEPVIVSSLDAVEGTAVRTALLEAGVHAYGCVPLIAKGRFEGALYVYDRRERRDIAADLAYLEALAGHAAVAIANARLYEAAEESLRQTRALQRVTASMTAGLDLEANLDAALSAAQQLFGADRAAIFLDDPETGTRRCAAAHGLSERYLAGVARYYRNGDAPNGPQEPYRYIADAQNDPGMGGLRDVCRDEGLRSLLFMTMNYHGASTGMFVLYHDTERRYSPTEIGLAHTLADQAAIALEHARLFAQVRHLAAVDERNRLARELHDSVTQSIFSISMIAQALPALLEQQPQRARERITRLGELARGALSEMRALIFQLRPAAIEQDGLVTAVRRFAAAFESREGVQVQVEVEGERRAPIEQEEALFRIVQEALNNIAKHAHAISVEIALAYTADRVTLCIHDDGIGLAAGRAGAGAPGHGFGMTSMRERAETIGGTLRVDSKPGEGTAIAAEIPLAPAVLPV